MTNPTNSDAPRRVDSHVHVGLRGDQHPGWGHISDRMRAARPMYDIFLLYADVKRDDDIDQTFMRRTLELIDGCSLEQVVCLALDHVWDKNGQPLASPKHTDFWVSNDYVFDIQRQRPDKVLVGASVHPYRPDFKAAVADCVTKGAVLLKWLPSGQQFSLEDPPVREAIKFLATAKNGKPLPLLLHVGVEYAVRSTNERTRSFDYLSWGFWDRFRNFWRREKWYVPNLKEVHRTLEEGLAAGAVIIMAHCGLPYFIAKASLFEHDDFPQVRRYLKRSARSEFPGRVYADVSACATPFRKGYFRNIAKLPPELLLFGSDYPCPVFELKFQLAEAWLDFKAMLAGDLKRIVIPQGNLIDVNYRELSLFFPGHPMFTNFDRYLR